MNYLNLSEGFNPYNAMPGEEIGFSSLVFPGGEPHIKLFPGTIDTNSDVQITTRINSSEDFMMLLVALDALKFIEWSRSVGFFLFIPYFPGARQDRVMVKGESLTAKLYADIFNDVFPEISVQSFDLHSDVVAACLNLGSSHYNNHKFVKKAVKEITRVIPATPADINMWGKEYHLVSPDAGSNKKILPLATVLGTSSIVKCDKTRDVSTGRLSGFEVYADDLEGRDAIIIDDICDGGGTFRGLAQELKAKNAGKLHLVVSHGIFSKGLKELLEVFTSIYTTDSIKDISEIAENKLLSTFNVIKLADVI